MAGKAGEDGVEPSVLDESAAEWAVERAEELDLEPHEFLERILLAYRRAETGDVPDEASRDALEDLEGGIQELETTMEELIEDVRGRVIQVKRETDEKAPKDHEHPALEEETEELASSVGSIEESLEKVRTRLDRGFENYEEILEYLLARTDEMAEDLETVGSAALELREKIETIAAREHQRRIADRLKQEAARHGVRTAKCEECDSKVDLALLSEATCPHCEETFRKLDPNPGFFGTSRLETGRRPALEGPSEIPNVDALESVVSVSAEPPDAPDREDWFAGTESPAEATPRGEDDAGE